VPTIGCRRCGGGLAGAAFVSNLDAGARLAVERGAELVVFDGSGAVIPPVATGRRILVAHELESGLNPYRALISDLVLTTAEEVALQAEALGRRALRFDLQLRPVEPLAGRRTALFTTGPARFEHVEEVVFASRNLADRAALRRDLESVDADVFLVELKAAAIDVVAEVAVERGAEVVLAAYDVEAPGLDEALLELAGLAVGARERENSRR
jgi:cyclic 2,3-diphosphoglycerate synthase